MIAVMGLTAALWVSVAQETTPDDMYREAVAARLSGDFQYAETLLEDVVEARPENADAWLQLGLARSANGEFEDADAAFEQTLILAPDYSDAWLGRARIAFFEGHYSRARQLARQAGGSVEAEVLLDRIDAAEAGPATTMWRVDVFGGLGEVTNGLDNWSEFGIALGRRLAPDSVVTLQADSAHRFGIDDQYLALRLDRALSPRAAGYIALGGSPDPVFRPETAVRAGLESAIQETAWSGSVDVFAGRYLSGNVQSLTIGLYRHIADERFRIGARVIGLSDESGETRSGFAIVGDWQASAPTRLSFDYTDAPETSEGVTLDVRAFTAGLRHQINDRRALSLTLVHEDRRAYDRSAFVAGASWRF